MQSKALYLLDFGSRPGIMVVGGCASLDPSYELFAATKGHSLSGAAARAKQNLEKERLFCIVRNDSGW